MNWKIIVRIRRSIAIRNLKKQLVWKCHLCLYNSSCLYLGLLLAHSVLIARPTSITHPAFNLVLLLAFRALIPAVLPCLASTSFCLYPILLVPYPASTLFILYLILSLPYPAYNFRQLYLILLLPYPAFTLSCLYLILFLPLTFPTSTLFASTKSHLNFILPQAFNTP